MAFTYHYGSKASSYSFIRIPKQLLTDTEFTDLSLEAKLLYGILVDRMDVALKNGWIDEQQRVYVLYPRDLIQKELRLSKKRATSAMRELERIGLIEKQSQGVGIPNRIYIKNFSSPIRQVSKSTHGKRAKKEVIYGTYHIL